MVPGIQVSVPPATRGAWASAVMFTSPASVSILTSRAPRLASPPAGREDGLERATEKQGTAPTMPALAREAGISRQALYLHFPDRAQLLLALVEYIDENEQLEAGIAAVTEAAGAAGSIRAWASMQAWRNPKIAAAVRPLDSTRHTDPAASAAWADRLANRMRGAHFIVERLRAEGRLDPAWTTTEAAALLWELTSFHVWDDLVNDAQIAPDCYVEIITAAALSALSAPVRRPCHS
jgi:AcrR family transcriptional regulator